MTPPLTGPVGVLSVPATRTPMLAPTMMSTPLYTSALVTWIGSAGPPLLFEYTDVTYRRRRPALALAGKGRAEYITVRRSLSRRNGGNSPLRFNDGTGGSGSSGRLNNQLSTTAVYSSGRI